MPTKKSNRIRSQAIKLRIIMDKGGKCEECGIDLIGNICCADFHHIDPSKKEYSPSDLLTKSYKNVLAEINECELLCSNCHRKKHFDYEHFNYYKSHIYEKAKNIHKIDGTIKYKDKLDEIKKLHEAGGFVRTISNDLGLSRSSVMLAIEHLGLSPNVFDNSKENSLEITYDKLKECCDKRMKAKDIAEYFGCSKATIFNYFNKYNLRSLGNGQKQ